MAEKVTPSHNIAWVAAGPIGRAPPVWHTTLRPAAPIVPTFCGRAIGKPELRHQLEPPSGTVCPICSNVIDQVVGWNPVPESLPYTWLTTVPWELEWEGLRRALMREDAIQAFADAALAPDQDKVDVRVITDGVEFMHFWTGPAGEPHFTLTRADGEGGNHP